jgi:hypothetical protein
MSNIIDFDAMRNKRNDAAFDKYLKESGLYMKYDEYTKEQAASILAEMKAHDDDEPDGAA